MRHRRLFVVATELAVTEQSLRKQVQLAASRLGARLFRVNTGQAWVGRVAGRPPDGTVVLVDARPIRMGLCTGGSDLIGWTEMTITPEMVGRTVAVFTAVELKTGRVPVTREQGVFLDAVRRAGGLAGVARSPADALAILADGAASSTSDLPHGSSTPSRRR